MARSTRPDCQHRRGATRRGGVHHPDDAAVGRGRGGWTAPVTSRSISSGSWVRLPDSRAKRTLPVRSRKMTLADVRTTGSVNVVPLLAVHATPSGSHAFPRSGLARPVSPSHEGRAPPQTCPAASEAPRTRVMICRAEFGLPALQYPSRARHRRRLTLMRLGNNACEPARPVDIGERRSQLRQGLCGPVP